MQVMKRLWIKGNGFGAESRISLAVIGHWLIVGQCHHTVFALVESSDNPVLHLSVLENNKLRMLWVK